MIYDNGFWRVCEALDCEQRIELLRYLIEVEKSEFPCVTKLAERFAISTAAISIHLKKLALAGLISMKRSDRKVYYRAFPTTMECEQVIGTLRRMFSMQPAPMRIQGFISYAHALSLARRALIVRCLNREPKLSVGELALRTDMPPQTADRLWCELNKAHIVDLDGVVVAPKEEPEAVLLKLTLA